MKPVLTAAEYKKVDRAYSGDIYDAMERAGYAVALAAARHGAGYGKRVTVLAGPGNNGGDGYVAARHLKRRGASVVVQRLGEPRTPEAAKAASRARAELVVIEEIVSPVECDLVIDAVLGGSARSGIPPEVIAWMDTDAPVIAVDFPTGLDPDTGAVDDAVFHAVETVTFSTLKTGHVNGAGPDVCGTVTVTDIGISGGRPSMFVAEASDALRPPRARTAHKWSAGSVLVVGGSEGMAGAVALATRSALCFGAGTAYVASINPEQAHQIAPQIPALTLLDAEARLDRFDIVVIGPGLAADDLPAVSPIARKARRVVLDAGGLVPEMLDATVDGDSEVVMTPHAAEFERIAGVGGGKFSVPSFAARRGVTLLLKGNPTIVTDGGLPVLVTTGGPELATIGTGDVLSGMVAALWARGLDPLAATISAAYWHGVAGADLKASGTVTAEALVASIAAYAW